MEFSVETLTADVQQEVHALISRYYDETPASVGIPPYDYMWSLYENLESMDKTLTVVARDGGKLVGFVMYLIMDHPHHVGLKVAHCDGIAVDHTMRGRGIGTGIYRTAEVVLTDMGIDKVIHHHRLVYNSTPLFPKLGFKLEEHVYVKELG